MSSFKKLPEEVTPARHWCLKLSSSSNLDSSIDIIKEIRKEQIVTEIIPDRKRNKDRKFGKEQER